MARNLTPEQRAQLRQEFRHPYRGLRQYLYLACGSAGFIGAVIFTAQLLAARGDWLATAGNLSVQVGVIALFGWLWRLDRDPKP